MKLHAVGAHQRSGAGDFWRTRNSEIDLGFKRRNASKLFF
jgi:hypothetical protein